MTEDEFEPARRELCPDGSCIGLIGPDGRCKVCGTVAPSAVADPRYRGMRAPRPVDDEGGEQVSELDSDRELCPDETCVGVIGPDGRCKVCGRRAEGGSADADGSAGARAEDGAADAGDPLPSSNPEFEDRELCPDGSCVGLIGPDGRCKVCGTARSSSAS